MAHKSDRRLSASVPLCEHKGRLGKTILFALLLYNGRCWYILTVKFNKNHSSS